MDADNREHRRRDRKLRRVAEQGSPSLKKNRSRKAKPLLVGRGQLSLTEHCLFPLDQKLRGKAFTHETSYPIYRRAKRPLTAQVKVFCPLGLVPYDEYILYGLLGLAFAEKDPSPDFYATTNFVLTRLGLDNGGAGYAQLDEAMNRLEVVTYTATNFYHPILSEFAKKISFGFVKRCVPLENEEERGWRFVFDSQFFELAEHIHGRFKFPFDLYAQLTPGARRLFLLLRKIFYRRPDTQAFDLHELSDRVLGYNPEYKTWTKKEKVVKAAQELLAADVISLSAGANRIQDEFVKRMKGKYEIIFHRGPRGSADTIRPRVHDSALYQMLQSLKISKTAIAEVMDTCKTHQIKEWVQITLSAKQRGIIKATAAAYFLDNIRKARLGKRGTPDWWQQLKRDEDREQAARAGRILRAQLREQAEAAGMTVPTFQEYLSDREALNSFHRIEREVFLRFSNLPVAQRKELAKTQALQRARKDYEAKFNVTPPDQPTSVGEIFRSM